MITNNKKFIILAIIVFIIILLIILLRPVSYKSRQEFEVIYLDPPSIAPSKLFDTNKLFDIHFNYIINNENKCKEKSNLLAVILVTSHFDNVETRSAMRRAFSSEQQQNFSIQRLFLLGVAPDSKYVSQKAVFQENERFGDLIQGNFKEAYRNLTYKHVMGLRWAARYCNNVQYVIKMDDDIVINMYRIIRLIDTIKLPKKNLLAGYILSGMKPIREPANKWFVTEEEYKYSLYPNFVSGWFYITNPKTCRKITETSLTVPYFWVDDIYVTGILAQRLRIKHYNLKEHYTVHPEFLQCCMHDVDKLHYDCEVLIGPNGGDNNLFFNFNEKMAVCYYKQCYKRKKPLNETCVAERKYSLGKGNALVETYRLS